MAIGDVEDHFLFATGVGASEKFGSVVVVILEHLESRRQGRDHMRVSGKKILFFTRFFKVGTKDDFLIRSF